MRQMLEDIRVGITESYNSDKFSFIVATLIASLISFLLVFFITDCTSGETEYYIGTIVGHEYIPEKEDCDYDSEKGEWKCVTIPASYAVYVKDDVGTVDKTYSEQYFNACKRGDEVQCKRTIGGITKSKYSPVIVRIID